jgi:thiol-disulfide isomerase/thioredoxin/outer membrane lipoprotein-sorting protein
MKRTSFFLMAALFLFSTASSAQGPLSADRVLHKIADKLASVKLLGYKYTFEYKRPSQERSIVETADAFLDLKPADGTSKFRFQFAGTDRSDTYNGAERFILDKKGKKLHVDSKPEFKSFGNINLQNAPIALKYALPKIIADASIPKKVTLITSANRDQFLIEFSLLRRTINSSGEIVEIRPDQTNVYRLLVDKATMLPAEVEQSSDKNDEIIKTTFADLTEKPQMPTALSWYFSTYQNEYTIQKKVKLTLIEAGKAAPAFSLASFESDAKFSLHQFKGKLTLLEFWIAHCGFCIAAVPKLNDVARKFGDKGLETVSINMYDPPATIDSFMKKTKPEFTILTGGDSIAAAYGVEAFPAFVLIDGSGKVIYSSSGMEEKELHAAIAVNLKQ